MSKVNQCIEDLLNTYNTVLFMKGSPEFPQCGASGKAAIVLQKLNIPFLSVDILKKNKIRQELQEFSQTTMIPQLYHNKRLIGGSDIIIKMYQNNELSVLGCVESTL